MDEGDPHAHTGQDFRQLSPRQPLRSPLYRRRRRLARLPPTIVPQPLAMVGARRGRGGGRRWRAGLLRLLLPLLLLGAACPPPGAQGRRLICWQAMLQCQEEPDCGYAYSQYAEACAPVLMAAGDGSAAASNRRRCPSHCISALIQLNHTRRGPALEDCDCDQDENCRATKRAIEPCLPRTGGGGAIGCTEARRRCDWDSRCSTALGRYMTHCGKLFNGVRCTEQCRAVIEDMMAVPKALLLNDCVCDGLERPICESVKENMARLCFGADAGANGAGSSGASDGAQDDYEDEEYEEEPAPRGRDELDDGVAVAGTGAEEGAVGGSGGSPCAVPWTLLPAASILLLLS
ncbi:growth arrest-specific protein 1 [Eublepharis macularius]|uniref:Growth arrest-specific protein 1 n=1 Tax=Eublepharis macularius TaxID=481883 RepID=A0AA97L862_EUBMA|nr:growth arrest-specific protein 1 [Eublepharis macularius]